MKICKREESDCHDVAPLKSLSFCVIKVGNFQESFPMLGGVTCSLSNFFSGDVTCVYAKAFIGEK